jgi:Phage integrase, N-terminal SAM-like domain
MPSAREAAGHPGADGAQAWVFRIGWFGRSEEDASWCGDILCEVEIQKRVLRSGGVRWRVRWRQGDRYRSQTFNRKGDAVTFAAEIRRRQQLGTLVATDRGRVTLAEYVIKTWAPAYGSNLARKTQLHYEQLLVKHVLPELGPLELRAITPETVARWQADRLADGYGRVAVRHAFDLLGSILQRAFEGGQIQTNPARAVRKAPRPRRAEVRPLPPVSIERMRAAGTARRRDADQRPRLRRSQAG